MKEVVYNLEAKKVGEVELLAEVFGVKANPDLLHEVAVSLAANRRRGVAHTKTRGDVRGGGRKPWKQKGTGNARVGSIRNPIWRGGGIVFGPRNTVNYKKKINKKAKRKAFLTVLSGKMADKELKIVESFGMTKPETKKMAVLFGKLKIENKSVLVVAEAKNDQLKKSLQNIKRVNYRLAGDVNSLDLLESKYIVFDKGAVEHYHQRYGSSKTVKDKKIKA